MTVRSPSKQKRAIDGELLSVTSHSTPLSCAGYNTVCCAAAFFRHSTILLSPLCLPPRSEPQSCAHTRLPLFWLHICQRSPFRLFSSSSHLLGTLSALAYLPILLLRSFPTRQGRFLTPLFIKSHFPSSQYTHNISLIELFITIT